MSSAVIQLIVLAGIAIFLILRLRNVLGTRDGFEKPPAPTPPVAAPDRPRREFEVIEGGIDQDIADHVDVNSKAGKALAAMKKVDADFHVGDFMNGARAAYEMLLMAFENGDKRTLRPYLSDEVFDSFSQAIDAREAEGLRIDANFIGIRDLGLIDADFNEATREGEITVNIVAELTSVVRNEAGEIVEGDPKQIKRQKDMWTFARVMGSKDPNWILVATGE